MLVAYDKKTNECIATFHPELAKEDCIDILDEAGYKRDSYYFVNEDAGK